MQPPRVSVVIPALNEENGIEATLRSVRACPTPQPLELVVADGNSTDRTVEIAQRYCDTVVIETTRTISAGRQAGARAAHGDILLFTDADSLVDPQWASRLARAFDDPQVVAAFGMIEPSDASTLERLALRYLVRAAATVFNLIGMDYVYGNNMAVRRTAFDKIGGMNIYLATAEDTDLVHRIRRMGKVAFVPGAEVRYSMRRIRKWGYPKYVWFHTSNFLKTLFLRAPAKHYEPVRE